MTKVTVVAVVIVRKTTYCHPHVVVVVVIVVTLVVKVTVVSIVTKVVVLTVVKVVTTVTVVTVVTKSSSQWKDSLLAWRRPLQRTPHIQLLQGPVRCIVRLEVGFEQDKDKVLVY